MTIEEMNTGLTKTINNAPTSNTKTGADNGMQPTDAAAVASFAGMLNDMYAAQRKANLDALEAEYTAAIGDLERQKAAIPAQFTKAKNATAGTNALERRSTNEMFTANGLSSGAKAQGNIAQSNALQRDLGELELAEARALADIEGQRSQISAQYQARVREAIMNNEMQKAAALYDEAIRYDNAMVGAAKEAAAAQKEKAAMLASVGDFSGYSALGYSPAEIAALQAGYQAKQYKGSGGGKPVDDTPKLSVADAKALAEQGDFSENVLATLRNAGYTDANLEYMYGYVPSFVPAAGGIGSEARAQDVINGWRRGEMTTGDAVSVLYNYTQNNLVDPDTAAYYLGVLGY